MSSGLAPAALAASFICGTAHEPSSMVATLPVAIIGLEPSQFVVSGSFSLNPPCTMSNSRPSVTYMILPGFHGAGSAGN